jgi:catechol 2,3-dioxygenase-like lactoylglutathione lyase family enzyme
MPSMLTNLILDVQDLDRSLAFYRDGLRLPVQRSEDCDGHRLAYLGSGATQLLLLQQPREEQDPTLDRSGGMVLKFYVKNLPATAKKLGRDAKVLQGLDQPAAGERTLLVADPDGYAVLLAEPVETRN